MVKKPTELVVTEDKLLSKIYHIRNHKVMLDMDLAELYEVETKRLKEAVKRNIVRFPVDFMFELTKKEWEDLRSQIATSKRGGTRYPPFAFTEQGVAMLSSVLNSSRAIEVNIAIMRIFVKMRQLVTGYKDLLKKVEKIEAAQLNNDEDIEHIYSLIKELLEPALKDREPVGFKTGKK